MDRLTYISLFSSAGVGCFGFQQERFSCIATNEIIERRLAVQRFNHKCKYESGYIAGDITLPTTQKAIIAEIGKWEKSEQTRGVDVLIATPPCQGMSVANHKKKTDEIHRNSLVTESIKLIQKISPKFFILENVSAFLKTTCTDIDGIDRPIKDAIERNLSDNYSICSRIINFKDYGVGSSRTRTVVIGVRKDLADTVSPIELFPDISQEKTLRKMIGHLKPLKNWGEIDEQDIYHAFRIYPKHMRSWISDIAEGQSAFDNSDPSKIPHKVIDGQIVVNQRKNGDKYKRQYWDKVGPCIHTRNDQLASQNTIHPTDDRVFSIRELMLLMTIPKEFAWSDVPFATLNDLSNTEKRTYLKREEMKIRQSIGEAVPTVIFRAIAHKISSYLRTKPLKKKEISAEIEAHSLSVSKNLITYIHTNPLNLGVATLGRIAELANAQRIANAAYFTNKFLVNEIVKYLPEHDGQNIRILEPSVGVGNFIPLILKKYESCPKITIDVVDIDENVLAVFRQIVMKMDLRSGITINYICDDFLTHQFDEKYDVVIGNPPFAKLSPADPKVALYRKNAHNKKTTNTFAFFIEKACALGDSVALITPKIILNTPEFALTREFLEKRKVNFIIDFGEKGFDGVLVETVCLGIIPNEKPNITCVESTTEKLCLNQRQSYIFDKRYPYWLIYRNEEFDRIAAKLQLGVFEAFRDRQITNTLLKNQGEIRVLKSRNINDNGTEIIDIPEYDAYMDEATAKRLAAYQFKNRVDVYLTPNMTYNPRVMRKPAGVITNGSIAILFLKEPLFPLSDKELLYFSTPEYRSFYKIARNYQTRSLNIDSTSVYFFGRPNFDGA